MFRSAIKQMGIVFRLAYLVDRPAGWSARRTESWKTRSRAAAGALCLKGAHVEVPRGMNGNKRPIAIAEHAVAVVTVPRPSSLLLSLTTKRRACRTVRSLSAMWIATKFRRSSGAAFLSPEIHQGDYEASVSGAVPSPPTCDNVDEPRNRRRRTYTSVFRAHAML